jgi:DNA topoisomerase I
MICPGLNRCLFDVTPSCATVASSTYRPVSGITNGRSKDEVVRISREMLHEAYDSKDKNKEDFAKTIWEGMDQDRILGPCWKCKEEGRAKEDGSPHMLRIIKARKSGKRFVGCSGYDPESEDGCDQTFPLPQRGDVFRIEERCSICGETPRLKVKGFRGRPWNLCLNDDCPSMVEMREKRAERQQAREEAEKRRAKDGGATDGDSAKPAKGKRAKRGSARKKPPATTARTKRARARRSDGSRTRAGSS